MVSREDTMRAHKVLYLISVISISFISFTVAEDLDLTIVYDNNPYDEKLETRWGFSCLVEGAERTILFDVGGEGPVLLHNMERLKIDPKVVDIVVLSHVHYDHIGGLPDFLEANPAVTVYMPVSLPQSIKDTVMDAGAQLVEVHEPVEICKDVHTTGELGTFIKEESLILKTTKGLVIITGCAHPGIVEIVAEAKDLLKTDVYLALGGFHLCWVNPIKINSIVKGLEELGVMRVAPCHCSGDVARKLFENAYGKDFVLVGVGKKIKIADAF
jgi:7,8-dihydropterin-6-yl-methyl-4-(beta-D-ribofuranosyl)aminobenzene 5'-phosphate synthase